MSRWGPAGEVDPERVERILRDAGWRTCRPGCPCRDVPATVTIEVDDVEAEVAEILRRLAEGS